MTEQSTVAADDPQGDQVYCTDTVHNSFQNEGSLHFYFKSDDF